MFCFNLLHPLLQPRAFSININCSVFSLRCVLQHSQLSLHFITNIFHPSTTLSYMFFTYRHCINFPWFVNNHHHFGLFLRYEQLAHLFKYIECSTSTINCLSINCSTIVLRHCCYSSHILRSHSYMIINCSCLPKICSSTHLTTKLCSYKPSWWCLWYGIITNALFYITTVTVIHQTFIHISPIHWSPNALYLK